MLHGYDLPSSWKANGITVDRFRLQLIHCYDQKNKQHSKLILPVASEPRAPSWHHHKRSRIGREQTQCTGEIPDTVPQIRWHCSKTEAYAAILLKRLWRYLNVMAQHTPISKRSRLNLVYSQSCITQSCKEQLACVVLVAMRWVGKNYFHEVKWPLNYE